MKDSIHELIELLKVNRTKSYWARDLSVRDIAEEMIEEVKEFEEALATGNKEHMKHELGDVFMDLLHLLLICEEQGHFSAEAPVQEVVKRLKWRKPFLTGEMDISSLEDERTIWHERKSAEKRPEDQ